MARIRTIKPEFFQDEKMAGMSVTDRFVFLGLISMADDAGRLLDNVKVIEAFIFPTTDDRVHESLMNLAREGRIRRGKTSSGQKVIQILGWSKHQYVQHPNMKAALPELVEDAPVIADATASHESFMNEDGGVHESFRLRPTTYDLRSTTYDQEETRAARAEPDSADTWLTPLRDAWESQGGIGSFNFGVAAKVYRPIVKRGVPPEELARRLRVYCRVMVNTGKTNFMNHPDFARRHQQFAGPLYENDTLTPLGKLATQPPPEAA